MDDIEHYIRRERERRIDALTARIARLQAEVKAARDHMNLTHTFDPKVYVTVRDWQLAIAVLYNNLIGVRSAVDQHNDLESP